MPIIDNFDVVSKQTTDQVIMVRPATFKMNEQTAVNNHYQKSTKDYSQKEIKEKSLLEFDGLVENLRSNGIGVTVIQDTVEHLTPDSLFPNNWLSLHSNGRAVLYPMFAENRRLERNLEVLDQLTAFGFENREVHDLSAWEDSNLFLEGTGSLVLDRVNKIAYAALSDRTAPELVEHFCKNFNYKAITFSALQPVKAKRLPIYHTNVMMCIGSSIAVVCLDCVDDFAERHKLKKSLLDTGKQLIEITESQVNAFAGNMLELRNNTGKAFMVLSTQAFDCLKKDQIKTIKKYAEIIHSPLYLIESLGGGSARCMIAENFLPIINAKG